LRHVAEFCRDFHVRITNFAGTARQAARTAEESVCCEACSRCPAFSGGNSRRQWAPFGLRFVANGAGTPGARERGDVAALGVARRERKQRLAFGIAGVAFFFLFCSGPNAKRVSSEGVRGQISRPRAAMDGIFVEGMTREKKKAERPVPARRCRDQVTTGGGLGSARQLRRCVTFPPHRCFGAGLAEVATMRQWPMSVSPFPISAGHAWWFQKG